MENVRSDLGMELNQREPTYIGNHHWISPVISVFDVE
jgi:hypothetical protein